MKAKISSRFFGHIILWLLLTAIACYGVYFLCANEITVEDRPMTSAERVALISLFGLVAINWASVVIGSLAAYFKKSAFVIDFRGISDTYMYTNFLCLAFFLRIRSIPWNAVKKIEKEGKLLKLDVEPSKVDAGMLARFFLRFGYTVPIFWSDADPTEVERRLRKYI